MASKYWPPDRRLWACNDFPGAALADRGAYVPDPARRTSWYHAIDDMSVDDGGTMYEEDAPLSRVTNGEIYRAVLRVDRRMDALSSSVVTKDVYDSDRLALSERINSNREFVQHEIQACSDAIAAVTKDWNDRYANARATRLWLIGIGIGLLTTIAYIVMGVLP